MGFIIILLFILCFTIQPSLLRSTIHLPVILLARRFFKKIKFMLVNRVVHQTSQIYWDTSVQSLAQSFFHRHLSCIEEEKQDWSMATNFLPEDMLVEILARLPVKSLLWFRSVAKYWRDMVKEPFFITKHHLNQVALNNGNCLLTRVSILGKHDNKFEFALLREDEQEMKLTFLELPFSLETPIYDGVNRYEMRYHVAGPCNGIVVISNGHDQLFLWNPATREYKAFPPAALSPTWSDKVYLRMFTVGFGIDPITKDYKVVRIWNLFAVIDGIRVYIDRAEVLSLSANKSCMWPKGGGESWKIIDDVSHVCLFRSFDSDGGAYLNGKYYWYFGMYGEEKCRIVWFDMGADVFGLVELPEQVYHFIPFLGRLTTAMLKGEFCLAMIRHAYGMEENKHMYHIWIIVDDEKGVSWRNYATVGPFSWSEAPLGFIGKNEELVVFNNCSNGDGGDYVIESYVYNINTRVKKNIKQRLFFDFNASLAIYNESLVSVLSED